MPGQEQYDKLFRTLDLLCDGESDRIALMATISCELYSAFEQFDWVGFYRNIGDETLKVGPYQGGHGCLRIAFGSFGPQWMEIAMVVGLSLISVVLWGVLVGSMLPFIMRGIGMDPATSSTPFVATIADITGLVIYLGLAASIL